MVLRIDLENRHITASVRDLSTLPEDTPRAVGLLTVARAETGQAAHRRYRLQREDSEESFTAEVVVELRHQVDGFTADISGRLDGLIPGPDRLLVEEVKSVGFPREQLSLMAWEMFPDYAFQVRLYGLALARKHPGLKVETRLVLVSILDGSQRELPVPFDAERTEALLDEALRARIARARIEAEQAASRRQRAAQLRFPYPQPRPHQLELAEFIQEGLEAERPVLAMAPTGVGKTVSALLPALRFALERNAILLFLTAKTTQQELIAETFRDLCAAAPDEGAPLRALTLRAKERMCPPATLLCHPDHCVYLRNLTSSSWRIPAMLELLQGGVHIDPDAVFAVGQAHVLCPFVLSLRLCTEVDLVIADYNYVYDPFVALNLFDETGPHRGTAVVIDEAHNLFDRAREYYSPFLRREDLATLQARLASKEFEAPEEETEQLWLSGFASRLDPAEVFGRISGLLEELGGMLEATQRRAEEEGLRALEGCRPVTLDRQAWKEAGEAALLALVRYAHYNQVHGIVRQDDPVLEILQTVLRIRDLARTDEREFLPYAAAGPDTPDGEGVGILCVNPAGKLTQRHRQVEGTVAMSATLTPLGYYADVLGFSPLDPVLTSLPSPFPDENRCIAILPVVSTTYRERANHYGDIAEIIQEIIAVRPGHYVAYFPSFRFLSQVQQRLRLERDRVLVQLPGMPQPQRERILQALRGGVAPRLLLAVMGGVFAEGVDLPGEALVGAIVVGPGLPQVGFVRGMMQEYFQETTEHGFAYAMLYPGMQRVIQSAGRVIRTPEDRGVIVLLDRRFARRPYIDCIPPHWYRYRPEDLITEDPIPLLEAFWSGTLPPGAR